MANDAYVDPILNAIQGIQYNPNEQGSWARGAVDRIDAALDSMTPTELMDRYRYLERQGIDDLKNYNEKTYGASTAKDQAYYSAFKNFKNVLGREPEANEFSQVAPVFYNPSDFGSGIATGRSYLSTIAQSEAQSPAALKKKAPDYYGSVGSVFQSLLGRAPTADEQSHFGGLLASGETDTYELGQFLSQTPEYVQKQAKTTADQYAAEDEASRAALGQELQKSDLDFFNKAKQDVLGQFAYTGGLQNKSSALDYALTDLMGNISKQRGSYMADLARQDYENRRAGTRQDVLGGRQIASQDYMNKMNQLYGNQQYSKERTAALSDYLTNRAFGGYDYATQARDYKKALQEMQRAQSQSGSPWARAAGGGLSGVGSMAPLGPWGAVAGGLLGAGAGYYS